MPLFGAARTDNAGDQFDEVRPVQMKRWSLKAKCILITVFACVAIALIILLWYLEHLHPLDTMLPTMSTTTMATPHVLSHTLHPRDVKHRGGYDNNTLLLIMNATHAILNKTNCWVCSHLPQHGERGLGWYIHPLPLTTACYASLRVLFFGRWNDSATGNFDGTNINDFERLVLTPLGCSIFANKSKPNIASTRPVDRLSRPYQSMITFKMASVGNKDAIPPSYTINHSPRSVPFCMRKKGTRQMGTFDRCTNIADLEQEERPLYIGGPVYFVCGDEAYPWLPRDWGGTCYLGILLPGVYLATTSEISRPRPRRQVDGDTTWEVFGDVAKSFIPFWGQAINSYNIRRLARVLEKTINETTDIMYNMTLEQKGIRLVALQNRMVLDIILAERGGVCKLVGSACCVFVPDSSPTIFKAIKRLHLLSTEIHVPRGDWNIGDWFWDMLRSWGWKIFSFLAIILSIVLFCCCCVQCLPAICTMIGGSCAQAVTKIELKPKLSQNTNNAMIAQDATIKGFMSIDISDENDSGCSDDDDSDTWSEEDAVFG